MSSTTMFVANRLKNSTMSSIIQISEKAQRLRAEGNDVINLCVGEPDFSTPESVFNAAKQAMANHQTKYPPTAGIPALKKAVSDKLLRDNGVHAASEQILIGNGAKQLLFNAFMATLNPGDEVLIPAPYWSSYTDMVRVAEGKSRIVYCSQNTGFKLTPELLAENITSKTRWLLLNSPSNPTGAVYTKQELQALASVLEDHPHVWIITDEIYEHLTYDNAYTSFATAAPQLLSRTLIINGLSKSYAMTGWRVGYAFGPEVLIKAMTSLQNYSTSGVCTIAQAAAVAALNGPQSLLDNRRTAFRARRDQVVADINAIPGLHCESPNGAFYLFIDCSKLIGKATPQGKVLADDTAVCQYLLEQALVAVVPGNAFGAPGFFRLSFACSSEELSQATQALEEACAALLDDNTKRISNGAGLAEAS